MLIATLERLIAAGDEAAVNGMARLGINVDRALGIRMPVIRKVARETGRDQALALQLWDTGIHEARLLAVLVADHREFTAELMDRWVAGFRSWDVCDQACLNLFVKNPLAYEKAGEWTGRVREYQKRAGFAMMAALAVHDKKAPDEKFIPFLSLIQSHAHDTRNYVKKSVSWALRQIGKRNPQLRELAIRTALQIGMQENRAARWIAADALRELQKPGK